MIKHLQSHLTVFLRTGNNKENVHITKINLYKKRRKKRKKRSHNLRTCFNHSRPRGGSTFSSVSTCSSYNPFLWVFLFFLLSGRYWNKYLFSLEKLKHRPARHHLLLYGPCSPCPERPSNHFTRSTEVGEGGINGESR